MKIEKRIDNLKVFSCGAICSEFDFGSVIFMVMFYLVILISSFKADAIVSIPAEIIFYLIGFSFISFFQFEMKRLLPERSESVSKWLSILTIICCITMLGWINIKNYVPSILSLDFGVIIGLVVLMAAKLYYFMVSFVLVSIYANISPWKIPLAFVPGLNVMIFKCEYDFVLKKRYGWFDFFSLNVLDEYIIFDKKEKEVPLFKKSPV